MFCVFHGGKTVFSLVDLGTFVPFRLTPYLRLKLCSSDHVYLSDPTSAHRKYGASLSGLRRQYLPAGTRACLSNEPEKGENLSYCGAYLPKGRSCWWQTGSRGSQSGGPVSCFPFPSCSGHLLSGISMRRLRKYLRKRGGKLIRRMIWALLRCTFMIVIRQFLRGLARNFGVMAQNEKDHSRLGPNGQGGQGG